MTENIATSIIDVRRISPIFYQNDMIRLIIHWIFATYTVLLFARIALSWFPDLYRYRFSHFIMFYTDPYLNVFRRVIPPLGGVLDISPILAFFALRFAERILLNIL